MLMNFDTFFAIISLYLNIRGLQKGPGQFFMGVLDFLSVKECEPCETVLVCSVHIYFLAYVETLCPACGKRKLTPFHAVDWI